MMTTIILLALLSTEPLPREVLFQPFGGFSKQGMAPVYQLFRADGEGRMLLRKARRKLGAGNSLDDVLCYCTAKELAAHPDRRGLFIQESARFYRLVEASTWREETRGGLARLADEARFPVVARQRDKNTFFEFMRVAFRPKVCVKSGMSNLETYLVLFHELTHLSGLDPFAGLDLHGFTAAEKRARFYHVQLAKPGGEEEAFLGQIQALTRLKERYDLRAVSPLEGFLNERGRLLTSNRSAFLEHLLEQANYRVELDMYLAEEIYRQYNRAHSWWTLYEDVLSQMATRMSKIEENIEVMRKAVANAGKQKDRRLEARYRKDLDRWLREKKADQKKAADFRREREKHANLMVFLDERFPE